MVEKNGRHQGDGKRSPYDIKSLCKALIPESIDLATEHGRYAHDYRFWRKVRGSSEVSNP